MAVIQLLKKKRKIELAKPFSDEMDLAFFVVNFGYSKSEYQELTEAEKLFIRKEHEKKSINDTTYIRDAVFNAVTNALRKKGSRFQELFKKRPARADKEFNQEAMSIVLEVEERDGKSWVDKIYQANGIKTPKSGGG